MTVLSTLSFFLQIKCQALIKTLLAARTNRRKMADIFINLPDKDSFPDYFQVIKKPICISQIRQNIATDKYAVRNSYFYWFSLV